MIKLEAAARLVATKDPDVEAAESQVDQAHEAVKMASPKGGHTKDDPAWKKYNNAQERLRVAVKRLTDLRDQKKAENT